MSEKWEMNEMWQSSLHNNARICLNRHFLTRRSRANNRDFGLSKHMLREIVHASQQDQVGKDENLHERESDIKYCVPLYEINTNQV